MSTVYKKADPNPNFSNIEQEVLTSWQKNKTFESSVRGGQQFVFYDGPPFANGLPHYGHLLTGFIKDTVARYQTMLGKRVDRRFGWDCHGLPAEMAAEKELGISGKMEIEKYGIEKFNDYCRTSVLRYTNEWKDYVDRQARWVDFENDYKTMNIDYMESVLWAFKTLYDKGLIYKSIRVMPYSWRCETPVSNFETRIDNAYREIQSKSIIVTFTLSEHTTRLQEIAKGKEMKLMVWTTTPWTLPSNLALAVGRDIEYSVIAKDDVYYIVAKALAGRYKNEIGDELITTIKGSDVVGSSYKPLFDYFAGHENAFRVFAGDFVSTEDGTGAVHIAPGFGEDDFELCQKHQIEVVCPVNNAGKFVFPIKEYIGKQVFETNDDIIIRLKGAGSWLKTEQYTHNYPFCWRTDTPLIYKAVDSWYLKVTDFKDKMIENNKQINWIPGHIRDGLFGKWLENTRDWSISRNRYWGCPIPVWISDDPQYPNIEVYGSVAELEEAFGVKVEDLHRPFIDTLVKKNPKDPTGKSKMRRAPEVLDCWFESGSMPYAQVHYPFKNKEWFHSNFPADFIVEYIAQTRGWFYTMMVLSTALFDKPPFLNCICHGVILGDGGQKLSKRLKNYADPNMVFEKFGADAMRWFMLSSPVMRGYELVIDKEASSIKDAVRAVIKPIWNAYNFFTLYANIDNIKAEPSLDSKNVLDQYIIAKCISVTHTIKKALDAYDTITATKEIESMLESMNNWYIRRSRERFWEGGLSENKICAFNTLYSVLNILCKAAAPMLPLITESIFKGINPDYAKERSVHLERFPEYEKGKEYDGLITNMERVRDACNAALKIRNDAKIRVRQPLESVTFVGVTGDSSFSNEMQQLVLDEINVKKWLNLPQERIKEFADYKLSLNLPIIGKRIPNKVQEIIKNVKGGKWSLVEGGSGKKNTDGDGDQDASEVVNKVKVADVILETDEFTLQLEPKEGYKDRTSSLNTHDGLVLLNLEITKELRDEGVARDFIRAIQQIRKDMDLDIVDRISVSVVSGKTSAQILKAVDRWKKYIKEQVLADDISVVNEKEKVCDNAHEISIEDGKVTAIINKN